MEVAIFKNYADEERKSKIEWKKLEEIKIEEEEIKENESIKIGFRFVSSGGGFEEAVENQEDENGYCMLLWKISKNLAELIKFDTKNGNNQSSCEKNDMILDASMVFIRSKFPRNIIYTQNFKENEFSEEELIRNGFYISADEDGGYGIFPPINFYPEIIHSLAEDDSRLKEISEQVIKVLEIFNENEKLGRNLFQEQFEPYFWRHCFEEPLFCGLRNAATKFFLERITKPITLESFNQGNFLFSSTSNATSVLSGDGDENTSFKWCSKMFSTIKGRLNALLNSQIFAETPQQYRQLFAVACHETAKFLIVQGKFEPALNILDEGIMKGIQFDDNNLGRLALYISSKLPLLPTIEICQSLYPIPKSPPTSTQIPILIRPSLEEFLQYLDRPVVIKDFVQNFLLYEFFDFDYLNNVHGYRRVPIEFGSSYAGEDYSQKIVTIHEYLRDFLTSKDSPKAYLAQHALLDQLNLLDSVPIPDYASLLSSEKDPLVNVFIGPSGTISPLHFDPRPNFFCQIRGRKFVRLVNPKYHDDVYLNPDPMYANSSIADLENLDFVKYPKLKDIVYEDVILEEGECLYMPEKYFHLMRSISPSISVSIWI